jgi:hypothetical protein
MGDYGEAKRTTNSNAFGDTAAPKRKPEPKGSDGSKPRGRQPDAKPRPKQLGATFDDVRPQMNPTYVDAVASVERHFRREAEICGLLDRAANNGFEAFRLRTSVEYNRSTAVALALFEAALALVPAGAAMLGVLKELTSGANAMKIAVKVAELGGDARRAENVIDRISQAQGVAKHLAEETKDVKLVKDAVEKVLVGHGTAEARTKAQATGDAQIEILHSLTELSADDMQARFSREDVVVGMLKLLETSAATNRLDKLVEETLGELPDGKGLGQAAVAAADEFEIKLYVQWYLDSGKTAKLVTYSNGTPVSESWEGMPDAVRERFRALGKLDLVESHPKLRRERDDREHFVGNKI